MRKGVLLTHLHNSTQSCIRSAWQTLRQGANKQPSSRIFVSFPMQTVELLFAQFVEFELLKTLLSYSDN